MTVAEDDVMTVASPSREICGASLRFTMMILDVVSFHSYGDVSSTLLYYEMLYMLGKIAYDKYSDSYWMLIWLLVNIPSKTVIRMVREAPVGSNMLWRQLHEKYAYETSVHTTNMS